MEFTKKNIEQIRDNTTSELTKDVIDYVLNEWDGYDDKRNIVLDVLNNGCQSGFVGHLVYYSQTTAYYEEYKEEINELLYDTMDECGIYVPSELFGDKWDKEDPLALYQSNQNLLAWFGFEETMRNFAREFEELEELIKKKLEEKRNEKN